METAICQSERCGPFCAKPACHLKHSPTCWDAQTNQMLSPADTLWLSDDSIRAHKLRAALTVLGLTMGVATLITVMTLVQGANLYVEQKIANLGTNVFRIARTPFVVTDFTVIV